MQRLRSRLAALAAQPLRAPLPPKKAKAADRGPAKVGELSRDVVPGLAVNKGDLETALKPDSEYPAWLWTLLGGGEGGAGSAAAGAGASSGGATASAGASAAAAAAATSLPETATVAELQRAYERGGGLSLAQMRRLFRLRNKRRVRDNNAATAKH
jgi:large subunit ribosomal protein L54